MSNQDSNVAGQGSSNIESNNVWHPTNEELRSLLGTQGLASSAGQPYVCPTCKKLFASLQALEAHRWEIEEIRRRHEAFVDQRWTQASLNQGQGRRVNPMPQLPPNHAHVPPFWRGQHPPQLIDFMGVERQQQAMATEAAEMENSHERPRRRARIADDFEPPLNLELTLGHIDLTLRL